MTADHSDQGGCSLHHLGCVRIQCLCLSMSGHVVLRGHKASAKRSQSLQTQTRCHAASAPKACKPCRSLHIHASLGLCCMSLLVDQRRLFAGGAEEAEQTIGSAPALWGATDQITQPPNAAGAEQQRQHAWTMQHVRPPRSVAACCARCSTTRRCVSSVSSCQHNRAGVAGPLASHADVPEALPSTGYRWQRRRADTAREAVPRV